MDNERINSNSVCERVTSKRFFTAYMNSLSCLIHMAVRVIPPLAIVRMTTEASTDPDWNTTAIQGNGSSIVLQGPEFNWDRPMQGLIVMSFFTDGIVINVLYGYATVKFGGKNVVTAGLLSSGIFLTVFPFGARLHYGLAVLVGFLASTFSISVITAAYSVIAIWTPADDRSTVMGLITTGRPLGIAITSAITGQLMTIRLSNGWPWPFYIFGIITIIWGVAWHFCMYDNPEEHPGISKEELEFILSSTTKGTKRQKNKSVPWIKILTSVPVWAYLLSQMSRQCIAVQLVSLVPMYFKDIHQLNVLQISLYVSILSIPRVVCPIPVGILSDYIARQNIWSLTANRKIFSSVGSFISVALFIILAYIDRGNSVGALVVFSVITAFYSVGYICVASAPVDIACNYSAVIGGIGRDVGQIPSIILTLGLFQVIKDGTLGQWQIVWWVSAACNFLGGVVFLLFGSAEIQPWDSGDVTSETTPIANMELREMKTTD